MVEAQQQPSGKLAAKMVAVMDAIGHVPKNGVNTKFNYRYALDADVLDAVRKALVANRVAAYTSVVHRADSELGKTSSGNVMRLTSVRVATTFVDADSGESFTVETEGDGSDTGDKAVYKAITGAVKYALMKTFLIPTGDDPEREDEDTGRGAGRQAARGTSRAGSGREDAKRGAAPASGPREITGKVAGVFRSADGKSYGVELEGDATRYTSTNIEHAQAAKAAKTAGVPLKLTVGPDGAIVASAVADGKAAA